MPTQPVSNDTLLAQLRWRYATKLFDPAKKIPDADWATLEQALILTPTSYGFQPYRFVVVSDPAMREKLLPHSWGQRQVVDACHYVVFAAKISVSEADVDHYVEHIARVRNAPVASLERLKTMLVGDIVKGPRSQYQHEWATRQTYIALGNFMTSAALLGIDVCPMEGIDPMKYDELLDLPAKGYKTVVAAAAGYRSADCKYARAPKVRYDAEELFIRI
jgi:nitroreductase